MTSSPPSPTKQKKEEPPVFLAKTYNLIEALPPQIGGWSETGEIFIIKDVEAFTNEWLGRFFSHKNLSSFVRQLNFYGFRKLKNSNFEMSMAHQFSSGHTIGQLLKHQNSSNSASKQNSKWMRFYHEKFRRGQFDLLVEMRRDRSVASATSSGPVNNKGSSSSGSSVSGKKNSSDIHITQLDAEVQKLKERVVTMNDSLNHLASLVESLDLNNNTTAAAAVSDDSCKKRKKVSDSTASIIPTCAGQVLPDEILSSSSGNNNSESDDDDAVVTMDPFTAPDIITSMTSSSNHNLYHHSNSINTSSTASSSMTDLAMVLDLSDEDSLDNLCSFSNDLSVLENDMEIIKNQAEIFNNNVVVQQSQSLASASSPTSGNHHDDFDNTSASSSVDPSTMATVKTCLSLLPSDMQKMFVDRLVETLLQPLMVEQITSSSPESSSSSSTANMNKNAAESTTIVASTANDALPAAMLTTMLSQLAPVLQQTTTQHNTTSASSTVVTTKEQRPALVHCKA